MNRNRWIQIAALALMAACLVGSGFLTTSVAASAGRNRLVYTDTAEQSDRPEVALGIAMGAFRGLFVNALWIRANELKQEGKYYEAVDLAEAITKLQPRFPRVWAFHAWNLAYNISVATQTPEERWHWVQAGIKLLRDEGIPANDNDLLLHKELAWLFIHKIQNVLDDAHWYYKRQLAKEWTEILGAPPQRTKELLDAKAWTDTLIDRWIQPIADAPATEQELYEKYPKAREVVRRLHDEAGENLDIGLLRHFESIRSDVKMLQELGLHMPGIDEDPLFKIVADESLRRAGMAVIYYTRRKVVEQDYHMEPDRMIRYMRSYGPIDWRHPAAHALYWAARGTENAELRMRKENKKDFDFLNTDRIVMQAIQELFRTGTLYFNYSNPDMYVAIPSADFIPSYRKYLEDTEYRGDVFRDPRLRVYRVETAGWENFMKDAIRFLYRRGQIEQASKLYTELGTYKGQNLNDPRRSQLLSKPLDEFVANEIVEEERYKNPQVALTEVNAALQGAYLDGLYSNNADLFESQFGYARLAYTAYAKEEVKQVVVSEQTNRGRMDMFGQPFDEYSATVLAQTILMLGLPDGALLYRRTPPFLQGKAYVRLETTDLKLQLDQAAQAEQTISFDGWFPPPEGVDLEADRVALRHAMGKDVQPANGPERATVESK